MCVVQFKPKNYQQMSIYRYDPIKMHVGDNEIELNKFKQAHE